MNSSFRAVQRLALVFSAIVHEVLEAERRSEAAAGKDTIVAAHDGYDGGGLHRWLLGDNYRDEWTKPIRAPFLDLGTYAGGLKAYKTGGGQATMARRMVRPRSAGA